MSEVQLETDALVDDLLRYPASFVHGWQHPLYAGYYCQPHHHETLEIVYHPTGRGHTTLATGERIGFAEEDVIIYGRLVRHDQSMDAPGIDACIQLAPHAAASPGVDQCRIAHVDDAGLRDEMLRLSQPLPLKSKAERAAADLRVTAVLARLLELSRPVGPAPEVARSQRHVESVRTYIRTHYATIGNVEEAARMAEISYHHLRHLFAEHYGVSMRQYLIDVRIDAAKRLLTHSPLPQKAIADLCGFANERYFSTCFRQRVGMTAGDYRDRTCTCAAKEAAHAEPVLERAST